MQKISISEITIDSLTQDIDVSGFCSSDEDLNDYLKENALRDLEYLYSSTHVVRYKDTVVGYFTLVNDTISPKFIDEEIGIKYKYSKLPAVKIARLATDKKYAGRGIGKIMMASIYGMVFDMIKSSGCRVITVDAKKNAQAFYERFEFKTVNSKKAYETIPMYIDIKILLNADSNT